MTADSTTSKPFSRSTVCVVDPDERIARRLTDLLTPLGAAVRAYSDAATLLAEAVPGAACIISEAHLPDMTGAGLIEALRHRGLDTPVILLAADGDVATAVAGMRAGALDFIEKPHADRLLAWHVTRLLENNGTAAGSRQD